MEKLIIFTAGHYEACVVIIVLYWLLFLSAYECALFSKKGKMNMSSISYGVLCFMLGQFFNVVLLKVNDAFNLAISAFVLIMPNLIFYICEFSYVIWLINKKKMEQKGITEIAYMIIWFTLISFFLYFPLPL